VFVRGRDESIRLHPQTGRRPILQAEKRSAIRFRVFRVFRGKKT
jgi:hypothetical protein